MLTNDQIEDVSIDINRLAELLGTDDPQRFSEHLGMFVSIFPELLETIRDAIRTQDATALHHAAHKSKGAANTAAATGLVRILRHLEVNASDSTWGDFQDCVQRLDIEFAAIEDFCAALENEE